ncbi:MAG TPA: tocopherol cyclase family protein [Blastocatellia bacterium]|nr:tocopherol cyclase family protein [Blastocatellia bacterium]
MLVRYEPVSRLAPTFADNLCRWDGRSAPHYEVWFLTLNHRESQRGFWFRYTVEAPILTTGAKPSAALWAAVFDRRSPERNFGLRREYEIDRLSFGEREDFSLRIGDGRFALSNAVGRVTNADHTVKWELNYIPCDSTYHHVSRTLNHLARPSSFVCSPNLDTRFTGRISIDGEDVILEDEPGCQSHLWGRKHVDDWVWVHSNAFENHPGTVFEGLAARPRRAGVKLPRVQSLYLRHRGQEQRFTRLRVAEQWQRKLGMGYWSFSAMNSRVYIEGAAQCRLRDMLQAEYVDPDGERLFCINSEVANLKIRLFRRTRGVRWRHMETIKAYATAHVEHASRSRDEGVALAF